MSVTATVQGVLPVAEVWTFVQVGREIGWLESLLALVAGTASFAEAARAGPSREGQCAGPAMMPAAPPPTHWP